MKAARRRSIPLLLGTTCVLILGTISLTTQEAEAQRIRVTPTMTCQALCVGELIACGIRAYNAASTFRDTAYANHARDHAACNGDAECEEHMDLALAYSLAAIDDAFWDDLETCSGGYGQCLASRGTASRQGICGG
jgi:hypothetical protein